MPQHDRTVRNPHLVSQCLTQHLYTPCAGDADYKKSLNLFKLTVELVCKYVTYMENGSAFCSKPHALSDIKTLPDVWLSWFRQARRASAQSRASIHLRHSSLLHQEQLRNATQAMPRVSYKGAAASARHCVSAALNGMTARILINVHKSHTYGLLFTEYRLFMHHYQQWPQVIEDTIQLCQTWEILRNLKAYALMT